MDITGRDILIVEVCRVMCAAHAHTHLLPQRVVSRPVRAHETRLVTGPESALSVLHTHTHAHAHTRTRKRTRKKLVRVHEKQAGGGLGGSPV